MHSFSAYIDESGDEGFTFREFPERASSEWFILSACVIRNSKTLEASRLLNETLSPIEERRKSPVHFANLPHDARVAIINQISKLPISAIAICVNKKELNPKHALDADRRLHFYCARFLLERISWITRDHAIAGEGNGKCKITFSHCKKLSYNSLKEYFEHLQKKDTKISWGSLDAANLRVLGHEKSPWLRVADAIASGIYQGLELNKYGLCEDRFARMLQPVIYKNGRNYSSYGMKLFPRVPEPEKERDNRYEWLSLYK